jgi:hypothetical protein
MPRLKSQLPKSYVKTSSYGTTNYKKPIRSNQNSFSIQSNKLEKLILTSIFGFSVVLSVVSLTLVFFPLLLSPSSVAKADSISQSSLKMITDFGNCSSCNQIKK